MKKHTFKPVTPQVNFAEIEEKWLAHWYEKGVVEKYLKRNKGAKETFSFIDGPITANNPMGVHHAWGRTYKDLWQRYHTLKGKEGRYQNGFDCQGLWVEVEVEKELGIRNKRDIENLVPGDKKESVAKFVDLCKQRVLKFSAIQTEQTKRLGNFMDWDHSYFTMSDENNYMIWYFLAQCHKKGWIYKGNESVPWCPRCETAISQHEMLTEDYKEVVHASIYLKLPLVYRKNEYLLVWTTTPWTIPANIAVAVDPKLEYSLVKGTTGDTYWVAKDLVEAVFKGQHQGVVKTVKGKELVGLKYRAPFDDLPAVKNAAEENPTLFHTVIATDPLLMPITTSEGTGFVHTAVSAGAEDFRLGKKLGLPMIPVIADDASYLDGLGFLTSKNAKKHPELIFDHLKELDKKGENWIFDIVNYKHRYPACWRCKTELVWKVAEEWYIAMDRPDPFDEKKRTYRQQMIEVAKKIKWMPEFGLSRELDWLKNMHDWLISKPNRYWGLALPIYECKKCGSFEVLSGKEELKKRAVEGWEEFEGHTPHKPWIDEVKIKCKKCGELVERLPDVGNVWLDAGIVPYSTLVDPATGEVSFTSDKKYWRKWFPADFITESFPGQFKNWFYSLIALSTALTSQAPFKRVLGFGTLLGEDGRPMHKSWGNSIEFNEGAKKIGADVMRWMYVTHDPSQNMLFGYKRADETRRRFHLILWNVYNFFISNALADRWMPTYCTTVSHNPLDMWILTRLSEVVQTTDHALNLFDVQSAAIGIERFVDDLSLWYVRRSRGRVGPSTENVEDKDDCYQTMYTVLLNLVKIIAPFMPFLSEEMYTNLTGDESVHLTNWPDPGQIPKVQGISSKMADARKLAALILSERKNHEVRVRIPLKKLTYVNASEFPADILDLVKEETNVYELVFSKKHENLTISGSFEIENLDIEAGETRELIRDIQKLRKEKNCTLTVQIELTLPEKYRTLRAELLSEIKRKTLAKTIVWGQELFISIG